MHNIAHLGRSPVYLHGLASGLPPLFPSGDDQTANVFNIAILVNVCEHAKE